MSHIPGLHTIELCRLNMTSVEVNTLKTFLSRLDNSLQHLCLSDMLFEKFTDLSTLLRHIPQLRLLERLELFRLEANENNHIAAKDTAITLKRPCIQEPSIMSTIVIRLYLAPVDIHEFSVMDEVFEDAHYDVW